jgi:glycosyltransferase involved in cell wall biosynthesis
MRLLVIMQHYPLPLTTGSTIVAYHSMEQLAKRHTIDFVSFMPNTGVAEKPAFITQQTLVPCTKLPSLISGFLVMLLGMPSFTVRNMRNTVTSLLNQHSYQSIVLFEMSAIQYCPAACYNKLFVSIEDPQSLRLKRIAALSVLSFGQKLRYAVLQCLSACVEARLLPKLAKVFLLSESDRVEMAEQGGYGNLAHLPYGISALNTEMLPVYAERERVVVFSGNMYHPANIDAALWLLSEIFPKILVAYPAARLWIVGADPDSRIVAAAAHFGEQVLITGRVDDVTMYLKRATVSICPVRVKIGVQTKILEALACGTPVVTTTAGNSGVTGQSGKELWEEDEAECLAQRVVELLQGQGWSSLSEQGRQLVVKGFTWEASAAQLEQYLTGERC